MAQPKTSPSTNRRNRAHARSEHGSGTPHRPTATGTATTSRGAGTTPGPGRGTGTPVAGALPAPAGVNPGDVGAVPIRRRPDGRYEARVQRDGRRRSVYGRTPQEVVEKLRRLGEDTDAAGVLPLPGKRTVADLLAAVLAHKQGRVAPRTYTDYEALCRRYLLPALGHVRLSRLTPRHIQCCYDELARQGIVRQAAAAHAFLAMALRLGQRWGWLGVLPTERVEPPRRGRTRRAVWTREELERFVGCPVVQRSPYFPLWIVALCSGCRPGELLALRWGDVDLERGVLQVHRAGQHVRGEWVEKAPKSAAGLRRVSLPAVAVEALRTLRKAAPTTDATPDPDPRALVFPARDGRKPLQLAVVNRALAQACQAAGVRHLSMHGFRHLHGSLLLDAGLPLAVVSVRLGHAHPGITASVYSHAVRADGAVDLLDRVLAAARTTD